MRTSAPAAWRDFFRSPIVSVTICIRSAGSSHQTGSGAIIAETRLPSAPCSDSARTLIGTIARSSSPEVECAAAAQVAAERAGDRGEDDVVDRAAEPVLRLP